VGDTTEIPGFTEEGLLPPGDYELTIDELASSPLVVGPSDRPADPQWDTPWRAHLVEQFSILVRQLWRVSVKEIFVDGSFAEDKGHPNDIDGYFVCDLMHLASGQLERDLNRLEPDKIWTWDPAARRPYRGYPKRQLPMWHKYRVELYPHYGQPSGIVDEHGNELEFPAAFRKSRRTNSPRGVIKIAKGTP